METDFNQRNYFFFLRTDLGLLINKITRGKTIIIITKVRIIFINVIDDKQLVSLIINRFDQLFYYVDENFLDLNGGKIVLSINEQLEEIKDIELFIDKNGCLCCNEKCIELILDEVKLFTDNNNINKFFKVLKEAETDSYITDVRDMMKDVEHIDFYDNGFEYQENDLIKKSKGIISGEVNYSIKFKDLKYFLVFVNSFCRKDKKRLNIMTNKTTGLYIGCVIDNNTINYFSI